MEPTLFLLILVFIFIQFITNHSIIARWVRNRFPAIMDHPMGRALFRPRFYKRQFAVPDTSRPPMQNAAVYRGNELDIASDTLHFVLNKYFPYYALLDANGKEKFVYRLQQFMACKTFVIYSPEPYREMPILVSASAIQLTFGLQQYMLPWFEYICIHPQEYIAIDPLRVLAGNVQGKSITVSWKHFFEETLAHTSGENVGLHEMAHALHLQKTYYFDRKGARFREAFYYFDHIDDALRKKEKTFDDRLFSDHALRNTDEFWAKSVELFFEKPTALYTRYHEVYTTLCLLLNQDPMQMLNFKDQGK